MTIINLRDFYPFYTTDCLVEVPDEVAETLLAADRKEAAYNLRTYRHKAYYSLDRDDGIEHEALFVALSPHEIYERKVTMQELHAAIAEGTEKVMTLNKWIPQKMGMQKLDIRQQTPPSLDIKHISP